MCILVLLQTITVTGNIKYLYRKHVYFHKYKYVRIPYSIRHIFKESALTIPAPLPAFISDINTADSREKDSAYIITIFPEN